MVTPKRPGPKKKPGPAKGSPGRRKDPAQRHDPHQRHPGEAGYRLPSGTRGLAGRLVPGSQEPLGTDGPVPVRFVNDVAHAAVVEGPGRMSQKARLGFYRDHETAIVDLASRQLRVGSRHAALLVAELASEEATRVWGQTLADRLLAASRARRIRVEW